MDFYVHINPYIPVIVPRMPKFEIFLPDRSSPRPSTVLRLVAPPQSARTGKALESLQTHALSPPWDSLANSPPSLPGLFLSVVVGIFPPAIITAIAIPQRGGGCPTGVNFLSHSLPGGWKTTHAAAMANHDMVRCLSPSGAALLRCACVFGRVHGQSVARGVSTGSEEVQRDDAQPGLWISHGSRCQRLPEGMQR